jgi:hypothetical protein
MAANVVQLDTLWTWNWPECITAFITALSFPSSRCMAYTSRLADVDRTATCMYLVSIKRCKYRAYCDGSAVHCDEVYQFCALPSNAQNRKGVSSGASWRIDL